MQELQWDANWIAAIGQIIGAAIAALAAWLAYRTAQTAERIAKNAVAATERQTAIGTIHDIANDYAGPEMYQALRRFGRFVANDPDRKAKFEGITNRFKANNFQLDLDTAKSDDFAWAVDHIEKDIELGAARRQIHHHFKRVWMLRRAKVLSDADLLLLTSANAGWFLWRNEVLPVTMALALIQENRGREFATADHWAPDLVRWVDEASPGGQRPD